MVKPSSSEASVAIVHDWFALLGGGEKVVSALIESAPNSEVFTVFNFQEEKVRAITQGRPVHVSGLNNLPFIDRYYRHLLLLAAREVERFDVTNFDVVISSSAAVGRGVITRPDQPHIGYILSPARYAWDLTNEYLRSHGYDRGLKGALAREVMHRFRNWDARTINGVDVPVSISEFVRRRVWKTYRRDSLVIYPPVDVDRFRRVKRTASRHFVTTSRLVDYKRVDLIVRSFSHLPDEKLIVIGDGPELPNLKSIATKNVEFLSYVSDVDLASIYGEAAAFVFAALEDFGIAPIEAQAAGIPVIALGKGGAAETIISDGLAGDVTGVHFAEQSPESMVQAIKHFLKLKGSIHPEACLRSSMRFGKGIFQEKMSALISNSHRYCDPSFKGKL